MQDFLIEVYIENTDPGSTKYKYRTEEALECLHFAILSFDSRRSAGLPTGLSSRQEMLLHSNQLGAQHASTTINH